MRIVITGQVVSNGGDAAILDAELDLVRRTWPRASITVHDSHPNVTGRLYPGLDVRPWLSDMPGRRASPLGRLLVLADRARLQVAAVLARLHLCPSLLLLRPSERPTVGSLLSADVVAHTGGTSLVETYPLDNKFRELELARAAGAAVVLLPQSLGPFREPANARRMRSIAQSSELILLRDERSRRHLEDVGVSGDRIVVVPDIVFAIGHEDASERLRRRVIPARPRVAISVRDCARFLNDSIGQDRYEIAIAGLVERLVHDHDVNVLFVSTCQGIPEYRMDDSAVALRVVDRLEPSVRTSVQVDRSRHDHASLTKVLGDQDVVVATRMHVGIIALGAGTPVLPLAYEFKTREVMTQIGLGEYVQDVAAVDARSLLDGYERLISALPALRPEVADALMDLRARARSLDAMLGSVVVAG